MKTLTIFWILCLLQSKTELEMYQCWSHSLDATLCPVVCKYVLQFNGDYEDVVARRLWSKGDHARISDSIFILAVDWFF